jgi:DNA-binding transcriptional regulator GbsR (MarR family)
MGRNFITIDDIPITVKVVLSTASVERVAILNLLLHKKRSITLSGITNVLPMSKSTALKAMTALAALKVVNMEDTIVGGNFTKQITLREEFSWLFTDKFDKLRQRFDPVDNSEYDTVEEAKDPEQQTSSSDQTVNHSDDLSTNPISSGCFQGGTALCVDGR